MSEESEGNKKIIAEFRANGGAVGGYFTGKTLLLLHATGAKSGRERINPLAYVRDGERFVVSASNNGASNHPSWYYNLLANPQATIEVGAETIQVHATIAEEPERSRLYDKMIEMMPIFGRYRREATRAIPVIVLTPTHTVL